jgi:hypothetical protein
MNSNTRKDDHMYLDDEPTTVFNVSLSGGHPAVQTLIDFFNREERMAIRVNDVEQVARVRSHQWEFSGGMVHRFELAVENSPPAMDIPLIYDDEQPDVVEIVRVWAGTEVRALSACEECTDQCRCSRIGECLRYRCAFGEVDKP